MVKTKLNTRAHKNPSTENPGTMFAASSIKSACITNVKSPKVRIVIGKVKIIKIGFKIALKIPMTSAAIRAAVKFVTCTPGKKYAAAKTASPLNIQLIKIVILFVEAPYFISIPFSYC